MGRGLIGFGRAAAAALFRRLLLLGVLLLLLFVAVELLPGDAASSSLGRGATPAEVAARRVELGLDRPLPVRFADWMTGLPRLDLGVTAGGETVWEAVGRRFANTLLLGSLALVLAGAASLLLGASCAARAGQRRDRRISRAALGVLALPEFVVASVLVLVLASWLELLPSVATTGAGGWLESPRMLILPVLALALPQAGWNTRIVRAAVLDAASAPHVEAARLDGLEPRRMLVYHVLPGALPTIVTSLATSAVSLLGGAIVVETVFNYPGVGTVLAGAVQDRDTILVAGVAALTGTTLMLTFLAADLARAWVVGECR
jgi:peptide/nickel transport system permease protein